MTIATDSKQYNTHANLLHQVSMSSFYKMETNKLLGAERTCIMRLTLDTLTTEHITVSETNMKMGCTFSFSTPSVKSCPKGVPCFKACYARAFEEKRGTVHLSYVNNMNQMLNHPKEVEDRICGCINGFGTKFFRFNVSGDVCVDPLRPYLYIDLIRNCSMRCKACKFLVFTKCDLWNNVDIERNLNVMYSYWLDWKVNNPKGFRATNVIKKPKKNDPIPTDLFICPNCLDKRIQCSDCHHCWGIPEFDYWKAKGIEMPDKVKEYYKNRDVKDMSITHFFAHGIHKNKL